MDDRPSAGSTEVSNASISSNGDVTAHAARKRLHAAVGENESNDGTMATSHGASSNTQADTSSQPLLSARRSSKRRATTPVLPIDPDEKPAPPPSTVGSNGTSNSTKITNDTTVESGKNEVLDTSTETGATTNYHQEQMQLYIRNLPPLQKTVPHIKKLTKAEIEELEFILEFHHKFSSHHNNSSTMGYDHGTNTSGKNYGRSRNNSPTTAASGGNNGDVPYDTWRDDWVGNLSMVEKEIVNPALHKSFIQQHRGSLATVKTLPNYPKKVLQQRQSLLEWASDVTGQHPASQPIAMRYIRLILQHVCTFSSASSSSPQVIPSTIKKVFGTINEQTSIGDIIFRIRRVSYDPQVLQEDGWTIKKSDQPIGASGGPYLIGDSILSDNAVAIIIAYIYDNDIGDLWKALYIDEDFLSFDLEAEELLEAKRKYNKKFGLATTVPAEISGNHDAANYETVGTALGTMPDETATSAPAAMDTTALSQMKRPTRSTISNDFTVKGIEHGIVLAASYSKGARFNVYWPARVVHASENYDTNNTITSLGSVMPTNATTNLSTGNKRNSSKQKVDVIFLSPYWTSDDIFGAGRQRRITESLLSTDDAGLKSNPLLMIETIDANDEMIKEFPITSSTLNNGNVNGGLDIGQLRISFRFTGLPKSVFPRYLDAHRLALALQLYAKNHVKTPSLSHQDRATAGLFETHPMSVQVPTFPRVVLHLPFHFILSKLPRYSSSIEKYSSSGHGTVEPIINLDSIVQSMTPPYCWNSTNEDTTKLDTHTTPFAGDEGTPMLLPMASDMIVPSLVHQPAMWMNGTPDKNDADEERAAITHFMTDFPLLNASFNRFYNSAPLVAVLSTLTRLLSQLGEEEELLDNIDGTPLDVRKMKLQSLIASWSILKKLGEESLASLISTVASKPVIREWRRAAEKIYHFMVAMFADGENMGNGLSVVATDGNCNGHITSNGSLERQVRLPAAVKGAKLAGAGCDGSMTRLITTIPARYIEYAETKILPKAHDVLYLKRMKTRCAAARTDDEVLVLTDDSDGEGGEDTVGSRGTWLAAVSGVAAAISVTDMVVHGECINAFCIVRPPGHHAGRTLHPMKAVSNGFCILNAVACAAIHATLPQSEGGLGLSRVCIIDFDAHHGNGTQDILCSTFDPRFLYVSLHAGGSEINGHAMEDDPDHELHDLVSHPKLSGIFPGRCGDTSPHEGVLNIPLGARVTSHAVGTALISQVSPKVEAFSPDLIILSAGFDAHKSDPMGLGALRAEDFGHITHVACELAFSSCSGRVVSVLEGGYGVPCCRPQKDLFLPKKSNDSSNKEMIGKNHIADGKNEVNDVGQSSVDTTGQSEPTTETPTVTGSGLGNTSKVAEVTARVNNDKTWKRPQPSKLLDLGDDLPESMDDQVPYALQARLEKCHNEGFVDCVFHHVQSLVQCNKLR